MKNEKRKMFYRVISFVLTLFTVVQMIPSMGKVYAADEDLTSIRGVYWFDPHEVGKDLTDTFIFDDNLLKGDSKEYNQKLATMSFELAVASISSEREPKTPEGYKNKSRNLKAYLEDNGFIDFDTNQYYKEKMTTGTMGVAMAHKKIVDNGKEYTLLALTPRSAGYESEWGGNFVVGSSEDHEGFRSGKNIVLSFAKEYIEKYNISGDIKVWTAGYSRGAGVTNQVGASLIDEPNEVLGSKVNLTPGNLYCYTFGTPKSAGVPDSVYPDPENSRFDYIHNTWESYDIVTLAPPRKFGFTRYGKNYTYAREENKTRMLEMLKSTNSLVYDLYMNGGDPDGFTAKTIDVEALIGDKEFKIVDDPDSYLPSDQREFMALVEDSLSEAIKDRGAYVDDGYQDAFLHLCGYFIGDTSKIPLLIEGMKESGFAIPMVASVYVSYMVDRFSETNYNDATKLEINKMISSLKHIIAEKQAAGEEVPEELINALKDMENDLQTADAWSDLADTSWEVSAALYKVAMGSGYIKCGMDKEDGELFAEMTGEKEAKAATRILAYLLLYDDDQTEQIISFSTITQQIKHFATFIGNASSYMRPHNNEIILSWLRTLDSNYDDYAKETAAQITGYRRLYITRPAGVNISGTVLDGAGNVVAEFTNDSITKRTDSWIGITTCDTGNWLRLPLDKAYKIQLKSDKDATLSLKAADYEIYSATEVRVVTKDSSFDWSNIGIKASEYLTWVIPANAASTAEPYSLLATANYYIENNKKDEPKKDTPKEEPKKADTVSKEVPVLAAKGIAKGKKAVTFSWNKISDADRYLIYMADFNKKGKANKLKKVKTVSGSKVKWTKKGLKKNSEYKFKVVAQKKVNGKYTNICSSKVGYFITGNLKGKYTNPKSIKISKADITINASKTAKISAKVKKVKKNKKLLTNKVKLLRYTSNNTSVATVNSKGVITAKAPGKCAIYVQTINGICKKVNVTVK